MRVKRRGEGTAKDGGDALNGYPWGWEGEDKVSGGGAREALTGMGQRRGSETRDKV